MTVGAGWMLELCRNGSSSTTSTGIGSKSMHGSLLKKGGSRGLARAWCGDGQTQSSNAFRHSSFSPKLRAVSQIHRSETFRRDPICLVTATNYVLAMSFERWVHAIIAPYLRGPAYPVICPSPGFLNPQVVGERHILIFSREASVISGHQWIWRADVTYAERLAVPATDTRALRRTPRRAWQ